jgi:tetratricopeptide (TPR) repeat protein
MSDRLAAARDYVAKKPNDRFGLYALAMELRKARIWGECFSAFDALLAAHPDYGAAYYHYGVAKRESGDFPGAREVLERGLAACTRSNDPKTMAEIQSAIEDIDLLS